MVTIMQVRSEDPEHTFLTPQELADLLPGVPLSRLGSWRRTGDGPPYVKFGRTVVYKLSDIEAWMAAQTHRSTGDTLPRGLRR
ncbi:helix-turn-helix transcriptional regulator [Microbacterium rhizophilus]|uniref:helix-turn-helix transcriptional regulator n=1 Tax=Microbacterium rhizophilus TaxID=3138934 RepID=UPI0031E886D3